MRTPFIALVGTPNSGKTTLFNALTGSNYKVANYPGVTVEKKEGALQLPSGKKIILSDLPGIYGIGGSSFDEQITSNIILGLDTHTRTPDLILIIADAINLERNLYLISQLLDQNTPTILCLNMMDEVESAGITIYRDLLEKKTNLPVVSISARTKSGLDELQKKIEDLLALEQKDAPHLLSWNKASEQVREELEHIRTDLESVANSPSPYVLAGAYLSQSIVPASASERELINQARARLITSGIDPFSYEASGRYQWAHSVARDVQRLPELKQFSWRAKIDNFISGKYTGLATFAIMMFCMFQAIFSWSSVPTELLDSLITKISGALIQIIPPGQIQSLLVDGILAGVGSVVVFVPQIALLFLFLGFLEDSGYLARAAVLMDRIMRPFGLQGRGFVPLLNSFGCAIPGILSTRSIPSWADRLTTIMVIPLMSCSARLPVYTLIIAAVIPATTVLGVFSLQSITFFGLYFLGIIGALFVALIMRRGFLHHNPTVFVLELPPLRAPSLRTTLRQVWDQVLGFLKNAGTIIFLCSIILWFLTTYPHYDEPQADIRARSSFAGQLGHILEPALKPLGFNWEIGVGLIAAFAAREVFVSSLATMYNVSTEGENSHSLLQLLKERHLQGDFSIATALSLLVFFVFACQCMSTLSVCYRETRSYKWPIIMFGYLTLLAYLASMLTYNVAYSLGL
ncbi:ferrous iron transport protein B [bacterium]|nr:ferrous iron transport protein B [bacterium]